MRKLLMVMAVIMAVVMAAGVAMAFPVVTDWDNIHSELYNWYYKDVDNDGYDADDLYASKAIGAGLTWGDTSIICSDYLEVEVSEKVWVNPDNPTEAVFSWTVYNDDSGKKISSFKVRGWPYTEYTAPSGWTFSYIDGWYVWMTDNCDMYGIESGSSLDNMKIYTKNYQGWGYGSAYVDWCDEHIETPSGDKWVTSHPVPEPATLLLLGTGLIGIAQLGRKKLRKK